MAESDPPPPPEQEDYAPYFRGKGSVEEFDLTAAKLRALKEGYFGLYWVIGVNIALSLGVAYVSRAAPEESALLITVLLLFVCILAAVAYRPVMKIGEGKGWAPGISIVALFLMVLNSAVCCGFLGYFVLMGISTQEMLRYGIVKRTFGPSRKRLDRRIETLLEEEAEAERRRPAV